MELPGTLSSHKPEKQKQKKSLRKNVSTFFKSWGECWPSIK